MVEQSAIGLLLNNCVIGVFCSKQWGDLVTVTVTMSQLADLCVSQDLSNARINPTSVSYFLLSPNMQIVLLRL